MKVSQSTLHSASIMFYYNHCQLEKLKINNGGFEVKPFSTSLPEKFVLQVIKPFEIEIQKLSLKFDIEWITKENYNCFDGDWRLYQLVIFNILQNAVKFNTKDGYIRVQLSLAPSLIEPNHSSLIESQYQNFTLETIIIDSGCGISLQD